MDGPLAASELCCHPNFTLRSKRAMLTGLAAMVGAATRQLGARGKVLAASLGSHFRNLTGQFYPAGDSGDAGQCPESAPLDSMAACCAGSEDAFFEATGPYEKGERMFAPFRQFNIPVRCAWVLY